MKELDFLVRKRIIQIRNTREKGRRFYVQYLHKKAGGGNLYAGHDVHMHPACLCGQFLP